MDSDFAKMLRTLREKAGLNQGELAKASGLTPSYISLLENRRKPPPSDQVIRKLSKALDVEETELLNQAHLERAPREVRKKVQSLEGGLRRQRRLNHKLMTDVLPISLYNFTRPDGYLEAALSTLGLGSKKTGLLRRLFSRFKRAGSYREFRRRNLPLLETLGEKEWEEIAGLMGGLHDGLPGVEKMADRCLPVFEHVPRPPCVETEAEPGDLEPVLPSVYSPARYFYRVTDEAMYPRCEPGDLLLADEEETARNGDIVLVRFGDTGMAAKMLDLGGMVEFSPANPGVPPRRIPKSRARSGEYKICAVCGELRRNFR